MTVGQSFKKVRKNFALTQKQMATGAQLSYRSYQEYEGDRIVPPAIAVIALANAYNISTDYLLGRVAINDSAVISEIAYDNGVMFVRFHNGDWYKYCNVSEDVYERFIAAPSKSKFFHEHVMSKFAGMPSDSPLVNE